MWNMLAKGTIMSEEKITKVFNKTCKTCGFVEPIRRYYEVKGHRFIGMVTNRPWHGKECPACHSDRAQKLYKPKEATLKKYREKDNTLTLDQVISLLKGEKITFTNGTTVFISGKKLYMEVQKLTIVDIVS